METIGLVGGVVVLLAAATAGVAVLRRRADLGIDPAIVDTLSRRVRAWWYLCTILAATILIGETATVILFGLISFWALREFITLTPTRPGDHRTLFWVFFLFTPLQFVLVGFGSYVYELFTVLIPVYVFLLIPARIAISGDYKRFLERTAKIQCGLLICVYCLSHAPALLNLRKASAAKAAAAATAEQTAKRTALDRIDALADDATPDAIVDAIRSPLKADDEESDPYRNIRLLFFFVLIVQLSDALQYACAHLPWRHVIAPSISDTRTWEGLLGGAAGVTLIGAALWWATPFTGQWWWMAGLMSLVVSLMGFAGGITMSAIKRDRGVKDYGTLVEGHGGVLDRIDSLCFAAPVFFHCTRFWLGG